MNFRAVCNRTPCAGVRFTDGGEFTRHMAKAHKVYPVKIGTSSSFISYGSVRTVNPLAPAKTTAQILTSVGRRKPQGAWDSLLEADSDG